MIVPTKHCECDNCSHTQCNYLKSVVDGLCTATSGPDASGFHLLWNDDDDNKDTQSDGEVCDLTEHAEKTMDRRKGKRRTSSSARGVDVQS